jgi:ribosomal protein S18 acetylase RimI-like enzyme
MEIRNLQSDGLNDCVSLYIQVFNSEPWNDTWTNEMAFMRLRHIFQTPGFIGYALYEEGIMNGFVAGYREQWFDGEHFNLIEFCIRSDRQGAGLGTRLLSHLERCLTKDGIRKIYLITMRNSLAEAFYMKNNYLVNENSIIHLLSRCNRLPQYLQRRFISVKDVLAQQILTHAVRRWL